MRNSFQPLEPRVLLSVNVLHSFNSIDGSDPYAALLCDSHGNVFGTTRSGGTSNTGTIFEIPTGTSNFVTLASFGSSTNNITGADPRTALIEDALGNLYGTAYSGGAASSGTIFELPTRTHTIVPLAAFNSATGYPYGNMVMDANGNLYGVSFSGGTYFDGAIYELAAGSHTITTLASFGGPFGDPGAGAQPNGPLVIDSQGNLYGMMQYNPTLGWCGTIFELPKDSSTITTVAAIPSLGTPGQFDLTFDSFGNLFGSVSAVGVGGKGMVFELPAGSSTITPIVSFDGTSAANPIGSLAIDNTGDIFGATAKGGIYGLGTVYEIPHGRNSIITLHSFSGTDGSTPEGGVTLDASGNLIGSASVGGDNSNGSLFEIPSALTATHLVFTQPPGTSVENHTAPSVSVAFEDATGNIVTTDNSNVTLSVIGSNGTLRGTLTLPLVNGQATFSDLSINWRGTYSLVASDPTDNLHGFISSAFTVLPDFKFVLTQPIPVTVTAGNFVLCSVQIQDQAGNLLNSDNSNVTITFPLNGTYSSRASSGVLSMYFSETIATTGALVLTDSTDGFSQTIANLTVLPAAPVSLKFTTTPTTAIAGQQIVANAISNTPVSVTLYDTYGNAATNSNATTTISTGNIPEPLSGNLTVNAVNGVATFSNLSITSAGLYRFIASAPALGKSVSSAYFSVNSAALAKLAWATQPITLTANIALSWSAYLLDQFNNLVTSDNSSTLTLSVLSGPGVFSGATTVKASQGVALFRNISLSAAGTYVLRLTDPAAGISIDTQSLTVNPAVPTKLAFLQQPSNVTAGKSSSPAITVAVEDALGNVINNINSNVTISLFGVGTLSGTTTVTAVNGIATFSDLSIDKVGQFFLVAADAADSLPSLDSNVFNVTPGTIKSLVFYQQPASSMTAGQPLVSVSGFSSVLIAAEDALGNVVTSDNATVTVATNDRLVPLAGSTSFQMVNGIATVVGATINYNGSYYLTAIDAAESLSVNSFGFTVNPLNGMKITFSQSSIPPLKTQIPVLLAFQITDQNGAPLNINDSSITLVLRSGPVAPFGTLTASTVNGLATFDNVIFTQPGTYVLSARDSTDGLIGDSGNLTLFVGPTRLVFLQQPTNARWRQTINPSVTVAVEDAAGSILTGAVTYVSVLANGPGTLVGGGPYLGSSISAQVVNGIATFNNLSLQVLGNYTLTASDLVDGLSGFSSAPFTVLQDIFTITINPMSSWIHSLAVSPPIVVTLRDHLGNTVTDANSNVTLSLPLNPSVLTGTTTVQAVNGIATFSNIAFHTTGDFVLNANDTSDSLSNSANITVLGPLPARLSLVQNYLGTQAGLWIGATVYIMDPANHIVTSDNSNITLTVSSSSLPSPKVVTIQATAGAIVFGWTLTVAGQYTITASDPSDNLSATSDPFTVSPAAPAKLLFTQQPANTAAGSPLNPISIAIEDQFNNLITSDNSNLALTIFSSSNPNALTVPGQAVNGIATFSNISLTTAGIYSITASNSSEPLSPVTSNRFTITPAAPAKLLLSPIPSPLIAGQPISLTATLEDPFGNIVTTDSSTLTASLASGTAQLLGTTTAQFSNGTTFFGNLSLNTPGQYALTLSDPADNLSATTTTFTIGSGAASRILFPHQPANIAANDPFSLTALLSDPFGNPTDQTVTFSLLKSPAGATLAGSKQVFSSNGTATAANLILNMPGLYTLRATAGNLIVDSAPFTVGPPPTHLAISHQPPATLLAGHTLPPITIQILDAANHLVTADNSFVTLSLPANAHLLSGPTRVQAANGIASFSNLSFSAAGKYTLTFTDGSLLNTKSITFTVTPDLSSAHLRLLTQPHPVPAGKPLAPTLTLDLEDRFGNLLTTDHSKVTLKLLASPSAKTLTGTTSVALKNGLASFPNLSITRRGTYTLTLLDPSLPQTTPLTFLQTIT